MRYRFLTLLLFLSSSLTAQTMLGVGTTVLTSAQLESFASPTLVFQPLEAPMTVHVNGALASQRGNVADPYSSRLHWATTLALDPWWLPGQGDLTIEITLQPGEGETPVLGPVRLMARADALTTVFWRNFWGPQAISALAWASLVVGLLSLFVYLNGHQLPSGDRQLYLIYFFLNLAFALSYTNNVFTWDLAPTLLLEKVSKIGLYWWLYFALLANLVYLRPKPNQHRLFVGLAVPVVVASLTQIMAPTVTLAGFWHFRLGLPVMGFLLLAVLFRTARLMLRKWDRQTTILVILYVTALVATIVDVYPLLTLRYKHQILVAPYTNFVSDLAFLLLLATQFYRLTATFEKRVETRTKELAEANQNLQFFISVMAHDLRNQVHGLARLGKETVEVARSKATTTADGDVLTLIQLMHDSARLTGQQLESLLAWSQVRLGILKPQFGPVVAQDLLTEVASEFQAQAQAGTVLLSVVSDPDTVVLCDHEMTRTMLRNLLANAVRYTRAGGSVLLESRQESSHVKLTVRDSGTGWIVPSADDLQAKGFGLRIVRALAEAQGFRVEIESAPGKGTDCRVLIPR